MLKDMLYNYSTLPYSQLAPLSTDVEKKRKTRKRDRKSQRKIKVDISKDSQMYNILLYHTANQHPYLQTQRKREKPGKETEKAIQPTSPLIYRGREKEKNQEKRQKKPKPNKSQYVERYCTIFYFVIQSTSPLRKRDRKIITIITKSILLDSLLQEKNFAI